MYYYFIKSVAEDSESVLANTAGFLLFVIIVVSYFYLTQLFIDCSLIPVYYVRLGSWAVFWRAFLYTAQRMCERKGVFFAFPELCGTQKPVFFYVLFTYWHCCWILLISSSRRDEHREVVVTELRLPVCTTLASLLVAHSPWCFSNAPIAHRQILLQCLRENTSIKKNYYHRDKIVMKKSLFPSKPYGES